MKITIEKISIINIALLDITKGGIDVLKYSTNIKEHQIINDISSLFQNIIKYNIIAPLCLLDLKEDNEKDLIGIVNVADGLFDVATSRCNCIEDNTTLRQIRGACNLTRKRIIEYLNSTILSIE